MKSMTKVAMVADNYVIETISQRCFLRRGLIGFVPAAANRFLFVAGIVVG
jgi:hypothetical protein